jgi:hypothetical protein
MGAVAMIAAISLVSYRRKHAKHTAQSMRLHREQQRWAMATASAAKTTRNCFSHFIEWAGTRRRSKAPAWGSTSPAS